MLPVLLLPIGFIQNIGMNKSVTFSLLMFVFPTEQTFKYGVWG